MIIAKCGHTSAGTGITALTATEATTAVVITVPKD